MEDVEDYWPVTYGSDNLTSFYENGGDSLTAVAMIMQMQQDGQNVSLEELLEQHHSEAPYSQTAPNQTSDNSSDWSITELKDISHGAAIDLLADCFIAKCELTKCCPSLTADHFAEWIKSFWPWLQEYSFGICDHNGKLRAFAASMDCCHSAVNADVNFHKYHPHLQDVSKYMDELVESVQDRIPDATLPGKVLEKGFFGTSSENNSAENVYLMNMLVQEFHQRAEKLGFRASFSQNSSPITQQLGELYGCERLLTADPRDYVNERGEKPFGKCEESIKVTIDVKYYGK